MSTITIHPGDSPYETATAAPHGALDAAWNWISGHTNWAIYATAGLLAILFALSIRSRRKRAKATAEQKQELTRTDRAITRITGILATAVVALGAWKVFGDVLHLHWFFRGVLFFFAEAQIIAAWRRVRRHVFRHAMLGRGTRTIYGIAFGSATVAAFDASSPVEVLLRFFAAAVAAYMIVEELAEELDIYLMAHPDKRPEGSLPQYAGRIKWAISVEGILVWLRLAQATEQTLADVERQRRIARFSRTAYRLDVLKQDKAAKWRIRWVRSRLRRQTEAANEHLHLATDPVLLGEVRAQLALLYGVEAGTSRQAVADLNPLRPAKRLEIASTPFFPPPVTPVEVADRASAAASGPATTARDEHAIVVANPAADILAAFTAIRDASLSGTDHASNTATEGAVPVASKPATPAAKKPATRRAKEVATEGVHPTALKLAKFLAKHPGETNVELAKRMRVGDRTVSRYRAEAEAHNTAQAAPVTTPPMAPIPEPKPAVVAGVNGYAHTTPEEN